MMNNIKDRLRVIKRRLRALKEGLRARVVRKIPSSEPTGGGRRSNLEVWKQLQNSHYFENHPCYKGISEFGGQEAIEAIRWFLPIHSDMRVAVIGCGFGRETLKLAPMVKEVYGIDVNHTILDKAVVFLSERGVGNFTPVLAETFAQTIPTDLDLVFSIVVMQHLTRDLVRHYFVELGRKLNTGGGFVVQFLDENTADYDGTDAPEHGGGEPSISWSHWQLVKLADLSGLKLVEIRTLLVTDAALWHWVYFRKEK
jgi:SAM-dependent methyltransferase